VAPFAFRLIGVHWRGPGRVWVRVHERARGWTDWVEVEAEGAADGGAGEGRAGWRLGLPVWAGVSDRYQLRTRGPVRRLATNIVSPSRSPLRRLTIAATPAIISRAGWGADEAIVRAAPYYAERLVRAVVHHTAGSLPATPAESAELLRAIQSYHVKGNGWNDIGYNFVVDPFGQVFEGRGGGVDRPVVGAHARGFNTGSVGVAVLGDYDRDALTPEARSALVGLLAWRLDVAHVDPQSLVSVVSAGNETYPAGVAVTLRAVSGHLDTDLTACPGGNLYAALDGVAAEASATGGPKLFEPLAAPAAPAVRPDGTLEPVRFTARLDAALPWTVAVTDGQGALVATGSGTGPAVDWSWDGVPAPGVVLVPGAPLTATFTSDPSVRPASLTFAGGAPSPAVADLRVAPATLAPDADGIDDTLAVTFALPIAAVVTVVVQTETGEHVATLLAQAPLPVGPAEARWAGLADAGAAAPDGRYRVVVRAEGGGAVVQGERSFVVDRTLGSLRVPPRFSPNGDGRRDVLAASFSLTRDASVSVRVRKGSSWVARPFEGPLPAGRHPLTWSPRAGNAAPGDGIYTVVVTASGELGTRTLSARTTLDATAPVLRVTAAWTTSRATKIVLRLSEPARLKVRIDAGVLTLDRTAGRVAIWQRSHATRVRVVARDAAGNASDPLRVRPGPRRR
jgi:hypothetical protein